MTTKGNVKKNIYDDIAESWYNLRHWTRFKRELENVATSWSGGRLLNIGCAHGPDFLPFAGKFELWGLDSSPQMVKMAVKYAVKFDFAVNLIVGDATALPFKDESFDYAIAVATYHHIQHRYLRERAFMELRRILKPGGEVFITVWNRGQKRFWTQGREVLLPWKSKESKLFRYYYLYTYGELEKLMRKSGFRIMKSFPEYGYRFPLKFFSRNICIFAKADQSFSV